MENQSNKPSIQLNFKTVLQNRYDTFNIGDLVTVHTATQEITGNIISFNIFERMINIENVSRETFSIELDNIIALI